VIVVCRQKFKLFYLTKLTMKNKSFQPLKWHKLGVMCCVTGAMAKGVSVGMCVAPLATFYCGRNIAYNGQRVGIVKAAH
jgi:hypothetical protein